MDKERIYVAMTYGFWGKGLTEESAVFEMKRAGASSAEIKRSGLIVKKLPEGAHSVFVDDMGAICWGGPNEPCETVKKVEPKKR